MDESGIEKVFKKLSDEELIMVNMYIDFMKLSEEGREVFISGLQDMQKKKATDKALQYLIKAGLYQNARSAYN